MQSGWRRRELCGAIVYSAAGCAMRRPVRPAGGTGVGLVLYQACLAARTPSLLANAGYIDRLPFDGLTVNIPASWNVMLPGQPLDYDEVYGSWLAPLRGRFQRVTRNLVLATVRKTDPFDDWTGVIASWTVLARAARDAGLAGILFDNEPYAERLWHWPDEVDYPYTLPAYQLQYRLRGRELMEALRAVWPDITVTVLHGPYLSDARTPQAVTNGQGVGDTSDLSGHFFVGLLQGYGGTAKVIDGGEVYQYRTPQDFATSYAWRKQQLPQLPAPAAGRPLIPPGVQADWPRRVSIGFGVYDLAWKPGYPMNPGVLRSTLANALARADDLVWLFTEGNGPHQYLVPGGVDQAWLDAIAAARGLPAQLSRRR